MPEILAPNWVARAAGELPPNPPLNPPPMPDYGQQAAAEQAPVAYWGNDPVFVRQEAAVAGGIVADQYTPTEVNNSTVASQRVTYLSDKEIAEFRLAALKEAINACDIYNIDPIAKAIQFSKFIFEGK